MRILSIVGARPQFIKAAIVSRKIRRKDMKEIMVHTGQHYDFNMSETFFRELHLPQPDYHLEIGSASHGEQTGKMLIEIERTLLKENSDMVLVYGDTNTTLAGALAASKIQIPVAHVEAGLRSFNKEMPEEINRVCTDHLSDLLFAPTKAAMDNLKNEGVTTGVSHVGDVMFDLALAVKENMQNKEQDILARYELASHDFILVTIHRASNTDSRENLEGICAAIIEIAAAGNTVFFPIHPRTKKMLSEFNLLSKNEIPSNLILSDPVSYTTMIVLESNARLIVTDSGGVQKEGYFFRTPCVIARKETEWVELVDCGWNFVAGTNKEDILDGTSEMLNKDFGNREWFNFYGDGRASERIVQILEEF